MQESNISFHCNYEDIDVVSAANTNVDAADNNNNNNNNNVLGQTNQMKKMHVHYIAAHDVSY